MTSDEANAKIETQPLTAKTKKQEKLKALHAFYAFHLLTHYVLFLLKDNFLKFI